MAHKFVAADKIELLEWLHVRHPGHIGPDLLKLAVEAKRPGAILFLISRIDTIEWDVNWAGSLAESVKAYPVVQIIDKWHTARVAA
ncbi:hypothetical protein HK105_201279 [Polyrhizophydium stewartii]|uniref:Uncharacterized protein n=1 Tax=Polyrhizophydium stewartii TaxID=2732419 RepID=A0ABR4NHS6_9FUNG